MPGMMETILNLGLNERPSKAWRKRTKNPRFAWDAYRRFVQMYSAVVIGLPKEDLEAQAARDEGRGSTLRTTPRSPPRAGKSSSQSTSLTLRKRPARTFPSIPTEQLWGAIGAVFESWMAEKAVTYRRVEHITGLLGTAVNVVQMVFGNTGENSGTGVCFTRDPSTGEKTFYGDFLINAQGEDVVAGIRTPMHLSELKR
jgi:pyruvate,orthophosphate dikinase